jgi:hypothetical protein
VLKIVLGRFEPQGIDRLQAVRGWHDLDSTTHVGHQRLGTLDEADIWFQSSQQVFGILIVFATALNAGERSRASFSKQYRERNGKSTPAQRTD